MISLKLSATNRTFFPSYLYLFAISMHFTASMKIPTEVNCYCSENLAKANVLGWDMALIQSFLAEIFGFR